MENEKNDKKDTTPKKAVTIRINEQINQAFDTKLEQIYQKKEHKKKGNTIEILMQQFTKQDTKVLKEYLFNKKTLINLSIFAENKQYLEQIQEKKLEINNLELLINDKDAQISTLEKSQNKIIESIDKKYSDEIQLLNQTITEKDKIIEDTRTHHQHLQQSMDKKYSDEIQLLNKSLNEKDKIIADKDKIIKDFKTNNQSVNDATIEQYKKQISLLEQSNQEKDNTIESLKNEREQAFKDIRTARNDYKHITERLNKLQDEFGIVNKENKEYSILFAEIDKMSVIERITKKYPKRFLELKSNK